MLTTNNKTRQLFDSANATSSVKLYGELLNKAKEEIVDTIQVNNNKVNLSAVIFRDTICAATTCNYKVVINGHAITGSIKELDYNSIVDKKQVFINIMSKISEQLSQKLVTLVLEDGYEI